MLLSLFRLNSTVSAYLSEWVLRTPSRVFNQLKNYKKKRFFRSNSALWTISSTVGLVEWNKLLCDATNWLRDIVHWPPGQNEPIDCVDNRIEREQIYSYTLLHSPIYHFQWEQMKQLLEQKNISSAFTAAPHERITRFFQRPFFCLLNFWQAILSSFIILFWLSTVCLLTRLPDPVSFCPHLKYQRQTTFDVLKRVLELLFSGRNVLLLNKLHAGYGRERWLCFILIKFVCSVHTLRSIILAC